MELRPCPFCRSDKVSIKTKERNHYGFAKYIVASVRCNVCDARGPAVGAKIQLGNYGTEKGRIAYAEAEKVLLDKAKEAWNNRA